MWKREEEEERREDRRRHREASTGCVVEPVTSSVGGTADTEFIL